MARKFSSVEEVLEGIQKMSEYFEARFNETGKFHDKRMMHWASDAVESLTWAISCETNDRRRDLEKKNEV